MRQAGLAVWKAHQIAGEMIEPGATTAEIDHAVADHFASLGAIPSVQGLSELRQEQTALSCRHLHVGQRGRGAWHSR